MRCIVNNIDSAGYMYAMTSIRWYCL